MPTENRSSNTEMVSVPFKREERYIVIKVSDLASVPVAVGKTFAEQLTAIQRRLPKRECLVIESDWPEYEPAWAAIKARVTGQPAEQHQGEPVAWCKPHWSGEYADYSWGASPPETACPELWKPLYTHADPGEVERLRAALKFYADREHYHFESGKWDTVSGEPSNILWCGDEPDFIEDGAVARAALERKPS